MISNVASGPTHSRIWRPCRAVRRSPTRLFYSSRKINAVIGERLKTDVDQKSAPDSFHARRRGDAVSTPQLENGYIRIANDLYDATIDSRLSKRELLVLHAVIRKTYGFGKKEDDLTMTQLAHITGLKRSHVGETVAEMHSKNVFLIRDGVHGKIIGIQKDTRAWLLEDTTSKAPSQNGNICSQNGNVPKTGNLCSQNGKSMFPKRDTQKTTPKDNTKGHLPMPTCPPRFDDFWTAYPKKKNKGRAESAFKKIKPEIFDDVMAGLERAKGSKDWAEQDGRFIPHPASWLNARGWEDDLETADENFRGML